MELRSIAPDNHTEVRALAVHPHQTRLVASVEKSLADAHVYAEARFRVAFHDGLPVGYVLVFPFDRGEQRCANIVRLMIDARFQGARG